MRKGGSNWVSGEDFFGRETELEILDERVREGTHTLLTAQRRMGKTSLVRELQRRLAETGEVETVFVDLEAALSPHFSYRSERPAAVPMFWLISGIPAAVQAA